MICSCLSTAFFIHVVIHDEPAFDGNISVLHKMVHLLFYSLFLCMFLMCKQMCFSHQHNILDQGGTRSVRQKYVQFINVLYIQLKARFIDTFQCIKFIILCIGDKISCQNSSRCIYHTYLGSSMVSLKHPISKSNSKLPQKCDPYDKFVQNKAHGLC